jgi:O-succinylbenzoic acid--CoA ligase
LTSLQGLKTILLGGGPVPQSLIKISTLKRLHVFKTYGLTEMASQVTATSPKNYPRRLDTAGKCLRFREIKISPNQEILVKGKTLFKGYIQSGRLKKPFMKGGWFRTGDVGRLDVNGYLMVKGRLDNMIISGGENIHPEEIEKMILTCPDVSRTIVLGIANKEFGRRPIAFIDPIHPQSFRPIKLKNYLKTNLESFKIPDRFYVWPKEWKTESMKLNRMKLSEDFKRRGRSFKRVF